MYERHWEKMKERTRAPGAKAQSSLFFLHKNQTLVLLKKLMIAKKKRNSLSGLKIKENMVDIWSIEKVKLLIQLGAKGLTGLWTTRQLGSNVLFILSNRVNLFDL